jgi:hypothetical protein
MIITIIIFHPLRGIIGNGGGSWCRVDSSRSSRKFSAGRLLIWHLLFSSELSRMMTLPSPGGLRMSRLRLPKSFLVNSASREVSAMEFFSSKDKERSITGGFPEELPCSKIGEQGQREEVSDRTLVVAEIQMAPVVELWRCWVKDFPLGRESTHV